MPYRLRPTSEFVDEARKLDYSVKEQVEKRLDRIRDNPKLSKPLRHEKNCFSERIGGWRILFKIDGEDIILYHIRKAMRPIERIRKNG